MIGEVVNWEMAWEEGGEAALKEEVLDAPGGEVREVAEASRVVGMLIMMLQG